MSLVISLLAGIIFSPHATNFIKPLDYTITQGNLDATTLYFRKGRTAAMGDANIIEYILSYRTFKKHLGVAISLYNASELGMGGSKSMAVAAESLRQWSRMLFVQLLVIPCYAESGI
jgi:hypothetical protein